MVRSSPAERVRERLRVLVGPGLAGRMPAGYQRLGRVLVLRLPEELRPYFPVLGRWWQEELGVATVLRIRGPVDGDQRTPVVEFLAGTDGRTEVLEHGIRFRLDASRLLFARGNRTERHRLGQLVHAGEVVVDLFAGIGYFALPAAVHGAGQVYAVEVNPEAFRYLEENIALNRVRSRVRSIPGDNRSVPLPEHSVDRVVLGLLPTALPWAALATHCLRPDGGWLHVHQVVDARAPSAAIVRDVASAVRPGHVDEARVREVKPYGPGRTHVVVDAHVTPKF